MSLSGSCWTLNVHFDLSYLNSYLSLLLILAPADLYCNNGAMCVMQMLVERRCNVFAFAFALPLFSFSSFLIRFTWISRLLPLAPTSKPIQLILFYLSFSLPTLIFIYSSGHLRIPSGYFEAFLFIECTRVIFRLRCASVKCHTNRWGFLRK